jgi:HEAT repeat protein
MEVNLMKTVTKLGLALVLTVFLTSVLLAHPLNDKEYDQYLIKALQDENLGIRTSAAQLLGERKVVEAVEPLAKMLKTEENTSARIVYAMALYQIGDEKATVALKKAAAKDKNKTVRRVVSAMVQKLESVEVAQK